MRCATAASVVVLAAAAAAQAGPSVRIAVFTLFKPTRMVVRADEPCVLNGRVVPAGGMAEIGRDPVRLDARGDGPAAFTLSVPGRISRAFRGSLETMFTSGVVTAIVTIDLETAVAATLAAEMPADAGSEALSAMAIAIRSYYAAGPRHDGYDFCDTTHCQFHRSPPRATGSIARAVERTRGMVVAFDGETFAPFYSAACGGRTRTPVEVGLRSGPYPYRAVECPACRREERSWRRDLPYELGAPLEEHASESRRLSLARAIGWSNAPPGNNYTVRRDGETLVFEGSGRGHGIGICQRGAIALAREGASWRAILERYLPDAVIRMLAEGGNAR